MILNFTWDSNSFRFETDVFVTGLDMAIELYALYRKIDPKGHGQLWVYKDVNGMCDIWNNETGETLAEMFENSAKEEA